MGEAKPYFEQFGHLVHHMTRVAISLPLHQNIGSGFAEVQRWEFSDNVHPIIPAWFGKHFEEKGWASTPLLAFLTEFGLLKSLKIREAIVTSRNRPRFGYPLVETRPVPSLSSSHRGPRLMEKG